MVKWKILDVLYPRKCAICDKILSKQEEDICLECSKKVKAIHGSICLVCGKPVERGQEKCVDCIRKKHNFDWGIACFRYQDVKGAIFRIKYAGREDLIPYFSKQIVNNLRSDILQMKADFIVPVPMHKRRERKRGYNQAELLARAIGKEMDIPVLPHAVIRKRKTRPMKYLSAKQRQLNLKRAFIIGENDVKLKTIILIDDIYTTGSTIDRVSAVLKYAGAKKIYFLTLAIGEDQER